MVWGGEGWGRMAGDTCVPCRVSCWELCHMGSHGTLTIHLIPWSIHLLAPIFLTVHDLHALETAHKWQTSFKVQGNSSLLALPEVIQLIVIFHRSGGFGLSVFLVLQSTHWYILLGTSECGSLQYNEAQVLSALNAGWKGDEVTVYNIPDATRILLKQ